MAGLSDEKLIATVEDRPTASLSEIATALNVSQSTISRRLRKLGFARTRSGRLSTDLDDHIRGTPSAAYRQAPKFVLSVKRIDRFVVVHTAEGAARHVGVYVESMRLPWIVGSIEGYNSLLVIIAGGPFEIENRYFPLLTERLMEADI